MKQTVEFVDLDCSGRRLRLEYQWLGVDAAAQPLLIFLHEGLGSLAMWKDFPHRLCAALGCRGLVYSRPGYGRSSPRPAHESWQADFLHRQAQEVLPALLKALDIDTQAHPPWLCGHSDGASIALLYAARYPQQLAAAIVLAPHILVEDISILSIERARRAYLETDLKQKLSRYHSDPDSAFWGWNNIWLHASFRDWSIEKELESICCPLLAIQGVDDEYGTLQQVRGIAARVAQTEVVELADCGHSPQRDRPRQVIAEVSRFVQTNQAYPSTAAAVKFAG